MPRLPFQEVVFKHFQFSFQPCGHGEGPPLVSSAFAEREEET